MAKLRSWSGLLIVIVMLIVAFLVISCIPQNNYSEDNAMPVDIELSSTSMHYSISEVLGKNIKLKASVIHAGGGTSSKVEWEVPNDTSAFKTQSTAGGVLTFQIYKWGRYVIYAHAKYKGQIVTTVQCVITVDDYLTNLRIYNVTDATTYIDDTAKLELTKGKSVIFSPVYIPSIAMDRNVVWMIDDSSIATISTQPDNQATLTAKTPGTATITLLSYDNPSIYCTLKVVVKDNFADQEIGVSSVALNSQLQSIEVGKSFIFDATVKNSHNGEMSTGTVEFSLDNDGTNSFQLSDVTSRTVKVTAVKGGEGVLTAKYTYTYTDSTTGTEKTEYLMATAKLTAIV